MQVVPSGGHAGNQFMQRHLVAKIGTEAQRTQGIDSVSQTISSACFHLNFRDSSKYRVNTLFPGSVVPLAMFIQMRQLLLGSLCRSVSQSDIVSAWLICNSSSSSSQCKQQTANSKKHDWPNMAKRAAGNAECEVPAFESQTEIPLQNNKSFHSRQ